MFYLANKAVNGAGLTVSQKQALAKAFEHHKHAELTEAEASYRKVLSLGPPCPEALSNLGSILIEKGKSRQALSLLNKANQLFPANAGITANLAASLGTLGQWSECLHYCEAASALDPANPMPWLWKARAFQATDRTENAIQLLSERLEDHGITDKQLLLSELILYLSGSGKRSRAIRNITAGLRQFPESTPILESALAVALSTDRISTFTKITRRLITQNGAPVKYLYYHAKLLISDKQEAEAITTLLDAVRLIPGHSASWRELGVILRRQKNYPKSIACLRRSLREKPTDKQAWSELIETLKENNQIAEAAEVASSARKAFPEDLSLLLNSAYTLNENGKGQQALALISAFFNNRPWLKRSHEAWNCEGLVLIRLQELRQAVTAFREGLRLNPSDSGLWNNMGMAYGMAGNRNAETLSYRNAIKHSPEDHGSHMNYAMALLAQRDFENGLQEYEWRLRAETPLHVRIHSGDLLTHDQSPKELYVCTEQGLGDVIQFSRYLHDLRIHYTTSEIILICPEKLIKLLAHSFPFIRRLVSTEAFDSQPQENLTYVPIMSIPAVLRMHPQCSTSPSSYIRVPADKQQKIGERIRSCVPEGALVIGLTWKGNPQTEKTNLYGRSMKLESLRVLADMLPNAVFLSAQKGLGSEEIEDCSFRHRFISIQEEISEDWCFVNNACYLLACDHVISTDTCNAHLSGALGVPTHLLLSSPCEWRWRGENEQSAWYKTMRTYQQLRAGAWREPIEAVANAILSAASTKIDADVDAHLG